MEILNEKAGRVNNGDDSVKGLLSRCGELFLGGGTQKEIGALSSLHSTKRAKRSDRFRTRGDDPLRPLSLCGWSTFMHGQVKSTSIQPHSVPASSQVVSTRNNAFDTVYLVSRFKMSGW